MEPTLLHATYAKQIKNLSYFLFFNDNKEYKSIFCQSLFCRVDSQIDECIWIAPASEGSDCGDDKVKYSN